jgi:hypothetical protein
MGNRGDVYERYYLPSFIDADCQAIYLGSTRREDLIRAIGRLERYEGAPDKLTDVQKREILNHPDIVKCIRDRERYAAKIKKRGYSTLKAAKDTLWYKRHSQAQGKLNSLKVKLSHALLEKTIEDFHETVHVGEVDRQMRGILPATEVLTPSTIEYELEERATVARLLFQPLDDLGDDQVFHVRVQLVQALAQLCTRQESPHQFKVSKSRKRSQPTDGFQTLCEPSEGCDIVMGTDDMVTNVQQSLRACVIDATVNSESILDSAQDLPNATNLYCAFCRWGDEEAGPRKRKHLFSRIDSLGRHVRVQHLKKRAKGFRCPYEGCSAFLGNAMHFLHHTARQHRLCL